MYELFLAMIGMPSIIPRVPKNIVTLTDRLMDKHSGTK